MMMMMMMMMMNHAQKACRYYGRQFLRSCGFKTSRNDISLRRTGNFYMANCVSLSEKSYFKKRPVYAVDGYWATKRLHFGRRFGIDVTKC